MTIEFTLEEIAGIERHFNVKWDTLPPSGKLIKGIVYRYSFSPEAIAKSIIDPSPVDLAIQAEMREERLQARRDKNDKLIISDDDGNDIGAQG